MFDSDTTCLQMRHVLRGGVSLLFRNRSPWIEFGYAVSAYSAHTTGRDVTGTTRSVDCRCQMRPDTRGVLPSRCDSLALPRCYLGSMQQIWIKQIQPDRCLKIFSLRYDQISRDFFF